MSQYHILTLILATLSGIGASYCFLRVVDLLQRNPRRSMRLRIQNLIQTQQRRFEDFVSNPEANQLFREAGHPLGLTNIRYQYIRFSILFILAGLFIIRAINTNLSFPGVIMGFGFLLVLLAISRAKKTSPFGMLLKSLAALQQAKKNRELFNLYALVRDEIETSRERSRNLLSILTEYREYFQLIRPAIDRALLHWKIDRDEAFLVFAQEVGTEEAWEVAKILGDIENLSVESAEQLIQDRQETMMNIQRENKRRMYKTYGQIAYAVGITPILFYGFNMLFLAQMEVEYLTNLTNQFRGR